ADVHWIDALYQAYLTALLGGAAVLIGAGFVGDGFLTPSQLARLTSNGPDWLGVVAAVVVAVGLRSGSRGGPIALEQAEVRHVLLAPVDRTTAMRGPAVRQLRFLLFVAAVAGAVAGILAAHRLPEEDITWAACGALFALTLIALGYGAALLASGLRIPSWITSLVGFALIAWAVADGANAFEGSPATAVGHIALWPLDFNVLGLIAIVVAIAALLVGLSLVGNVSVEAAERRSTLVGQLRFAATLQDVRTVIVLRRQLAMELPRLRPWLRTRSAGTRRFPVWGRGLQGLLRWPAARVARLVLLGAVAGVSARAAWAGTSPLIAVSGIALYLAALDAVEPLAQEVDHPTRRNSVPIAPGAVELRHVPVAVVAMVLVAVVGAVAAVLAGPSVAALEIAAACALPAALGAVCGALVSVLAGAPSQGGTGDTWSLMPPEVAGMRIVYRSAWPPAMAVIGIVPVLAARTAARHGVSAPPVALAAGGGVLVLFILVCGWVRQRDQIHAWWRRQMDAAIPRREPEVAADG
ncbi:MAG TPA: hypothetical protein VGZ52_09230, partial [Acidimicrobiales bacterium]|nr:hypothetical protein [Acidimicrobiales bacterium]